MATSTHLYSLTERRPAPVYFSAIGTRWLCDACYRTPGVYSMDVHIVGPLSTALNPDAFLRRSQPEWCEGCGR